MILKLFYEVSRKVLSTFCKTSMNFFEMFCEPFPARLGRRNPNAASALQKPLDVSPKTFHGFASHIRRIFKNLWEVCVGLPASAFPMKSKTFPGLFRPCACFSAQLLLHLLIFDLTQ